MSSDAMSLTDIDALAARVKLEFGALDFLFVNAGYGKFAPLEGTDETLILNGVIDHAAMKGEMLSQDELLAVIHRQGFDDFDEVEECSIGPNGQFYVRGRQPSQEDERHGVLLARLDELTRELVDLKARLPPAATH